MGVNTAPVISCHPSLLGLPAAAAQALGPVHLGKLTCSVREAILCPGGGGKATRKMDRIEPGPGRGKNSSDLTSTQRPNSIPVCARHPR